MKNTHPLESILVFIMVIAAYGYFYAGTDWNTNSRLALIRAVVEENRFEIDSFVNYGLQTRDTAKFRDHFYSDKAIGSSLIGILFYFPIHTLAGRPVKTEIFKELMTFLVSSLISAFLAPFLYAYAKKISNSARMALITTIVICLGTPFYKYSTIYYGHTLAGLFLFTVFFIWFNIKNEEKINPMKILISGYLLGFSIITEYPTAIIALCLGLYILYVLHKKGSLYQIKTYLPLILGAVIPLILTMTYNKLVFQSPFKTGYSYEVIDLFSKGHGQGLMGIGLPNLNNLFYMTFHTTMGIFWQSPVLLLAAIGWFGMWKSNQYRAEAALSFGIVSIYFLIMSGYYIWWGGLAFTPRNIIPTLPFFGIPLAFLIKKPQKIVMICLGLLSMIQMFIVAATVPAGLNPITDIEHMSQTSISSMFTQPSMIYNLYLPNFLNQFLLPNRGQEFFHLTGFLSLLPLILFEAILLAIFIKITQGPTSVPEVNKDIKHVQIN